VVSIREADITYASQQCDGSLFKEKLLELILTEHQEPLEPMQTYF
jgi:hypothetical protein